MYGMLKSEFLKMRHTFAMKLVFFAPLATLLLGYILSGSYVQLSAYNWWYTIILPVLVSMLSASMIVRERNTGMQNILCLPVSSSKIWLGKILALLLLVFGANLLLWLVTTMVGFTTSMEVSPMNGLVGCMLLALTFLWQIPFVMLLTSLMGYFPALILSVGANLLLSTIGAEKGWFFLDPYAIPARVVCPFFGMHPNGLPLEDSSSLLDVATVVPGVLIGLTLLVLMAWVGSRLFWEGVRKYD
ncbi:MAG: lantibiotic immunity ABC transporter MutE/EpiE family permease subunit [Clostridiales bacterium]|nr:lantibiotic immunity ABC transporter MutE/EpiE family permease subunit [Clostridiales bacterium]